MDINRGEWKPLVHVILPGIWSVSTSQLAARLDAPLVIFQRDLLRKEDLVSLWRCCASRICRVVNAVVRAAVSH